MKASTREDFIKIETLIVSSSKVLEKFSEKLERAPQIDTIVGV